MIELEIVVIALPFIFFGVISWGIGYICGRNDEQRIKELEKVSKERGN